MNYKKFGKNIGYITMFLIFTTILYFILHIFKKLPDNWGYIHVLVVVFIINLIGIFLNKKLK